MNKLLSLCLVALIAVACTNKTDPVPVGEPRTPEQTVQNFVDISARAESLEDKKKLQELCLGELRRAFDRMTEEMFRISYLNHKIKVVEFQILETKKEGDRAVVRYRISIENPQGTDPTQEINEREVELAFAQGNWFIEAIRATGTDHIAFTRGMMF